MEKGIYYGREFESMAPSILSIALDSTTESYFARRSVLPGYPEPPGDDGLLRLFPLSRKGGARDDSGNAVRWDPIASAFFLLAGWQEWVIGIRDVHGRFPYAQSILARYDLAGDPQVDRYRRFIREQLEGLGWTLRRRLWNGRDSAVCITHDVDYHRKWRPGVLYGETIERVIKGRPSGRVRGFGRLVGSLASGIWRGDPFRQSLNEMVAVESVEGFGATWFFKAGAHGRYDVDYSLESGWIRKIIDHLNIEGFEIGLHTSYFASDHESYLDEEQQRLQAAVTGALQSVRSHYLRWFTSRTAQMYANAGFFIDSTLGFAEREGFRNGTCVPFRIFDVGRNSPLDIWELPVAVMDTTLYGYRDLEQQAGIDATRRLLDVTAEFGGVLVILWHNIMLDPLGDKRIAPHFTAIVNDLDPKRVFVASLRDALSMWLDQTAATRHGNE